MKNEWLISSNIDVTDIENSIPFCEAVEIDTSGKSTTGENSKQYDFKSFSPLTKCIIEKIKNIKNDFFDISNYEAIASWLVEGGENGYHRVHRHCNDKSGIDNLVVVIYTDVPEDSYVGEFYFLLKKENDIILDTITPKRGTIIIMPCTVYHGVYPQGKGLRRTINMDFKLKGTNA